MGRRKPTSLSSLAALFMLGICCLGLFTVYIREGETGPLHTVQLGAAEVLQPVRNVAGVATEPLAAVRDGVNGALQNDAELDRLREEVRQNEELAAQASRLKAENDRLQDLLRGQRDFYEYGPLAEVVAPVGGELTERIVINVGSEAGVGPEMPVVVGDNTLVGRTTGQVTENTAEVILISDRNFAAGVRIVPPADFDPASGEVSSAISDPDASYGEGLLKTSWEGYLGVDFVDLGARAEKGDFVVTSGRAGERELLFPPGLLVGTIETVSSRDIDQYKNIVVDPAVSPDDLEEVRVIVDW